MSQCAIFHSHVMWPLNTVRHMLQAINQEVYWLITCNIVLDLQISSSAKISKPYNHLQFFFKYNTWAHYEGHHLA